MAAYLRHRETGDLYPYNHDLALRDDMEPCAPSPSELGIELEEQKKPRRKRAARRTAAQIAEDNAAAEAAAAETEESSGEEDADGDVDLSGLDDLGDDQ